MAYLSQASFYSHVGENVLVIAQQHVLIAPPRVVMAHRHKEVQIPVIVVVGKAEPPPFRWERQDLNGCAVVGEEALALVLQQQMTVTESSAKARSGQPSLLKPAAMLGVERG